MARIRLEYYSHRNVSIAATTRGDLQATGSDIPLGIHH